MTHFLALRPKLSSALTLLLEEFARALQMTTTTLYLANYDDLEREGAFLRATQTKPRLLG